MSPPGMSAEGSPGGAGVLPARLGCRWDPRRWPGGRRRFQPQEAPSWERPDPPLSPARPLPAPGAALAPPTPHRGAPPHPAAPGLRLSLSPGDATLK